MAVKHCRRYDSQGLVALVAVKDWIGRCGSHRLAMVVASKVWALDESKMVF